MSLSVTKPDTADLIRAIEDLRTASMDLSSAYLKETNLSERQASILNEIKEIQAAIEAFVKTLEKQGDQSYKKLIQSYGEKLKEIQSYLESLAELEKIEKIISEMQTAMPDELKAVLKEFNDLCNEYLTLTNELHKIEEDILKQEKLLLVIDILLHNQNPPSDRHGKDKYPILTKELESIANEHNLVGAGKAELQNRKNEGNEKLVELNKEKGSKNEERNVVGDRIIKFYEKNLQIDKKNDFKLDENVLKNINQLMFNLNKVDSNSQVQSSKMKNS